MPVVPPDNAFRITPNPRFVYPGQLDAALDGVAAAIAAGRDAAVLGEPGVGKTLLLRLVAQAHEASAEIRFAAAGPGFDPSTLFAPSDRPLVVLLDEAQALTAPELRRIWRDARGRREAGARASLVLAGRPRLEPIAAEAELVLDWFCLTRLSVAEAPQLVRGRLAEAGAAEDAFAPEALEEVARRSRGVPRLLNLVCSNALFRAQAEQADQVTLAHAQAAADALELPQPPPEAEAAPVAAVPPAPATVIGQAGAAMADPERREGRMGWRALASGLALFAGGLAGLALLLAMTSPEPPAPALTKTASAVASSTPEPVDETIRRSFPLDEVERVAARIALHYSTFDPAGERIARRLARSLTEHGFQAAVVRPVRARIDSTSVRYFFESDLAKAARVNALVARELGPRAAGRARVQDLTHYEPKPSEGAIEIWLGHATRGSRTEDIPLRRVRDEVGPPTLRPAGARDWP